MIYGFVRRSGIGVAVVLGLVFGYSGAASAQSENQLALFNALNGACAGVGNFPALCGATVAGGNAEFQEATAEEIGANTRLATQASNGQLGAIAGRLAAIRGGATGFVVNGATPYDKVASILPASMHGASMHGRGAGDDDAFGGAGALAGFLNVKYGFGTNDADSFESEFDFDSYGATLGLDYRLSDALVVGGAFGYSFYDVDFDSDAQASADGELEVDSYSVSAYGTWYQDNLYVDGTLTFGWSDHELERDIFTAPATPVTATSDTEGMSYGATLSAGMNIVQDATTITPYVRASYQDTEIDGFTEGGSAAQFTLRLDDQEFDSFIGELGVQASHAVSTSFGVVLPFLRGAYKHEFLNDDETTKAVFVNQAALNTFNIKTREGDEDYFSVGAGASAVFKGGIQGFVSYDTVLGLSDIESHLITAGVRVEF